LIRLTVAVIRLAIDVINIATLSISGKVTTPLHSTAPPWESGLKGFLLGLPPNPLLLKLGTGSNAGFPKPFFFDNTLPNGCRRRFLHPSALFFVHFFIFLKHLRELGLSNISLIYLKKTIKDA